MSPPTMMDSSLGQFKWKQGTESLLLGDLHPLLQQLGSADGLSSLHATSEYLLCPRIENLETLGIFLQAYELQLLYPLELPAIYQAHHHASQNHSRELIALDQALARQPVRPDFARASRRIGQSHLQKLRPLRDNRLVQRYLAAVEEGSADGWHTLVFGVTLAVYSLPVRQGLMNYARQTLAGFIHAAAHPLHLPMKDSLSLLEEHCLQLPARLENIIEAAESL